MEYRGGSQNSVLLSTNRRKQNYAQWNSGTQPLPAIKSDSNVQQNKDVRLLNDKHTPHCTSIQRTERRPLTENCPLLLYAFKVNDCSKNWSQAKLKLEIKLDKSKPQC